MDEVDRINHRLGVVNLLELSEDRFVVLGETPEWLEHFNPGMSEQVTFSLADTLLFFDSYLEEVRYVLSGDPEAILNSGPWSETDRSGVERNLSATVFDLDGRLIVQLKLIDDSRLYHQAVFQKAREYSMGFERLMKERERREVLLHTIVHDLAGPLTAIHGALEVLESDPGRSQLLKIALRQCEVEKQMIGSILDTFSADFAPFDPDSITWESAPRLLGILRDQLEIFRAPFQSQGVRLDLVEDLSGIGPDVRVFAEWELLERVLSNLLQNAMRFSPRDTTTRIEVANDGNKLRVSVVDHGEGVPDSIRSRLFERFSGGQRFGGKVGLGLYFCRITLQRWNETIWCEPAVARSGPDDNPGTRMTFTLTALEAPADD